MRLARKLDSNSVEREFFDAVKSDSTIARLIPHTLLLPRHQLKLEHNVKTRHSGSISLPSYDLPLTACCTEGFQRTKDGWKSEQW